MSHHHHRHSDKNQNKDSKPVESGVRPVLPLVNNSDIPLLSLIKPLLSPSGQKIVDLLIALSGNGDTKNVSLDIQALLSQSSGLAENDSLKELLNTLSNGTGSGNNGGINPVLINTLLTLLNNKKESENAE